MLFLFLYLFLIQLLKPAVLTLELRNRILHQSYHVIDADGAGELFQFVGDAGGGGVVVLADLGDADAGVVRREGVLRVGENLLVEFLAGSQATVHDLDVLAGFEAGEFDHAVGEVADLDGLAHVEDVDLVAGAHRGGFHHEAAGLGNGHEEAGDVRVGNRYRASLGDLVPEPRNHRAIGAEDVAESCRDELGAARVGALLYGEAEGLDVDLGEALGAAHDVGRVDGLVGRYHHHLLDVIFYTFVGHVPGAGDVDKH